jgi:hypothetical protein
MAERSEHSNVNVVVIDKDGDALLILKNWKENLKSWNASDSNNGNPSHGSHESNVATESTDEPRGLFVTRNPAVAQIQYRISSALLRKVSRRFNAMFTNNIDKTITVSDDGMYHITIQGFTPKAVEHVMNIIHIKTRCLPKKVDLEVLAHIVALVDDYGMEEAVSFHIDIWTNAVAKNKTPDMCCRDLMLQSYLAKMVG